MTFADFKAGSRSLWEFSKAYKLVVLFWAVVVVAVLGATIGSLLHKVKVPTVKALG